MNLIVFASPLHDADSVLSCRQALFEKLRDMNFRRQYGLPEDGELNIFDANGIGIVLPPAGFRFVYPRFDCVLTPRGTMAACNGGRRDAFCPAWLRSPACGCML